MLAAQVPHTLSSSSIEEHACNKDLGIDKQLEWIYDDDVDAELAAEVELLRAPYKPFEWDDDGGLLSEPDRDQFAGLWREVEPIAIAKGYALDIEQYVEGKDRPHYWEQFEGRSGLAIPATKDGRVYYVRSMGKDSEEHKCTLRLLQYAHFEPPMPPPVDIFEGPRDRVYVVMDKLKPHWLAAPHTVEGQTMSVDYFLYTVTRMLQNLARLHAAGVAHLDIRPYNVMLDDDGLPVFIDFRQSIVVGDEPSKRLCTVPHAGTTLIPETTQFGYHAPQRESEEPFDGRADDVYAVGILLERSYFTTPSQKA
ncbi:hypothetical protein DACRYDRAFT_23994 [Dacryopinax primogenitus]|uniref:Protein kinase domain-containing protein n=1 Tax=Dacryopinax primogenitus (strain DJM 731) TaxID=1858805 RepID=M5FZ65_DACPD|nr:uncharacterized protein DACRYDRAFT_23994 [Dacryopinax primogenitus]EJT98866.1 hypothetical protein DACRYDRAFT_23994 [Dacryopinax primogenitus]